MENLTLLTQFAKGKDLKRIETKEQNAVIYTRVSSKEQADTNKSLDWQLKYCNDYAVKNNMQVLGFFGGTYESAKTDERNEFNRMIRFVKNQKEKISYILVYSLDRFSRSGENAIYISSELKKRGIQIVSVTQPIDASTHTGTLQQNIQFIFSKYDNDLRTQKTIDGMREKLRRGEWTGGCPLGYSYEGVAGERYQRIVINATGKLLRHAFHWKALENMTHTTIAEKLAKRGLKIDRKRLTEIFRNPFYCGYLSNRILKGEIVKGNHEALVSEQIFLQVNNLMSRKNKNEREWKDNENLPLKHFVKCFYCKTPYTGYLVKSKNLYYYKCNSIGCKCNRSAKEMERKFQDLLSKFSVNDALMAPLQLQITKQFSAVTENVSADKRQLSEKINQTRDKLEAVEERFATGEIDREVFTRISEKLKTEIAKIKEEIRHLAQEISNPEKVISFALEMAQNLNKIWYSGSLQQKLILQKLIFPNGLHYDRRNDIYRTEKINRVFHEIISFPTTYKNKKSGKSEKNADDSALVAPPGIEPGSKVPETFILSIELGSQ